MKSSIKKDLDTLSKNLYLESPDLWIEFLDKVNSGIFDELVLFFATKYNYISIVKYATRQNNYKDFSDYFSNLKNPNKEISQNNENDKTNIKTKNKDINIPSVICKKCKSNIFEVGYIVCENKIFKFSPEENKPVEIAKEDLNSVICCNCNSLIENTTPKDLEALCNITTCINCKNDLRSTGIIDKRSLIYNKDSNKFDLGETYYACGKCEKAISDQQKDYFKLK